MARYIDADKLKDNFCDACTTLKRYGRTVEECRNKTDTYGNRCFKMRLIDTTPTADVAPRAEVAREIFEEIDRMIFGHIIPNDCAIISLVKLAELKNKYAEGQK
jgi:hypothetical protein